MPWDLKLSTFITLGSGYCHTIIDQSAGTGPGQIQYRYYTGRPEKHSLIIPGAWGYRSVDLRLESLGVQAIAEFTLVAEAFYVSDDENFDPASCNGNISGPGQPTELPEPGRRLQFGASYSF